jgi:hypothetical protein
LRLIRFNLQRTGIFLRPVSHRLGIASAGRQRPGTLFSLIGITLRLLLLNLPPQRTTACLATG